MIKLSQRLQAIADLVPVGCRLADIGSDHALLPSYLATEGRISFGVAGEINDGPWTAAQKQIENVGLEQIISVRKGNGLEVLSPGEVDTVVIAGMGGGTITEILSAGKEKLRGVRRLILQPNVAEDVVRRWLVQHSWSLQQEKILEEDGVIYEILVADKPNLEITSIEEQNQSLYADRVLECGVKVDSELLFKLGPSLIEQGDPVFISKWEYYLEKQKSICTNLGSSTSEEARNRKLELEREMAQIKEVLACLQKGIT